MSENDFNVLNGSSYRGSRYSNFAGGGINAQGNVSPFSTEASSNQTQTPTAPTVAQGFGSSSPVSQGLISPPKAPPTLGKTLTNDAIGAALPYAGTQIGRVAGAAIGEGSGVGQALGEGVSSFANKVSGGLIGAPSVSAAGLPGSSLYGPPNPASGGASATGAAGLGAAAGSGLGTFAADLLTGKSFGQSAVSGLGSAAGYVVGNLILPGVGGFIGSSLGSLLGGLVGGGQQRSSIGAGLIADPTTGLYKTQFVNNDKASNTQATKYANSIGQVLNSFQSVIGNNYGFKYSSTNNFTAGATIGDKAPATYYDGKIISSKPGDVGATALSFFKDPSHYSKGTDAAFNTYWDQSLASSKTINDLAAKIDAYAANPSAYGGSSPAVPSAASAPSTPAPSLATIEPNTPQFRGPPVVIGGIPRSAPGRYTRHSLSPTA